MPVIIPTILLILLKGGESQVILFNSPAECEAVAPVLWEEALDQKQVLAMQCFEIEDPKIPRFEIEF